MEDLEGKAEDTGIIEISEMTCVKPGCRGHLQYKTGEAVYECNICQKKYDPKDVLS
jgi:LSD1 subclass zinc finger protein